MKKLALAAALVVVGLGQSGTAMAQRYTNYPVCAVYGWRTQSCAFMNFAQCYMSVSGRGGYCELNPFYEPPRGRRNATRGRY